MRQIVLDTETTGLDPKDGHRVIEIGCVEIIDRRLTGDRFHHYVQPDRPIEAAAVEIHGITNAFLTDKPRFAEIAQAFLNFVGGAELIIHNAAFDLGFLDAELRRWQPDTGALSDRCTVTDTLPMARRLHPGQRNSLDALCRRYGVENRHRELHGALLDAELLAEVYLAMTGGQASLVLVTDTAPHTDPAPAPGYPQPATPLRRLNGTRRPRVIHADAAALAAHDARLAAIEAAAPSGCLWLQRPRPDQ